ncbi:hypothetical protein [Dactylosporangium maewongense]|uniref:hypothetical protein n=1 Tax=Dactylosporangium maewongense TaxID=634393 RepID=UPI003CD0603F
MSRALAGSDLLPTGTRRRIEQAAGDRGYHPNRVARAEHRVHRQRRAARADLLNPYFAAVVRGVTAPSAIRAARAPAVCFRRTARRGSVRAC